MSPFFSHARIIATPFCHTSHPSIFQVSAVCLVLQVLKTDQMTLSFTSFNGYPSATVSHKIWTVFAVNVSIAALLLPFFLPHPPDSIPDSIHHSAANTLQLHISDTLSCSGLSSLCLEHSPITTLPGCFFKCFQVAT